MKGSLLSESIIFRIAFSVFIIFSAESCKENNKPESDHKNEIFGNNIKEEKEAHFFIAIANLNKKIISKSQIAQQKALQNNVKELSRKLEYQQNIFFQQIAKIANKKLIIIAEVNAAGNDDLYELMNTGPQNFDKIYLNDMKNEIADEIELLRTITKQTKDESILKLAHSILPVQYELLKETQELNKEIN